MFLIINFKISNLPKPKKTIQLFHSKAPKGKIRLEVSYEFHNEKFSLERDEFCRENHERFLELHELHKEKVALLNSKLDIQRLEQITSHIKSQKLITEQELATRIRNEFPHVFL
jgi:hypothetical protein